MQSYLRAALMSILLAASGSTMADVRSDYEQWQAQRLARLTQPYGWLSLVGLHFLKPGTNTFGSAEGNTVQLASGAAMLGAIDLKDGGYLLSAEPDAGVKVDDKNVGQIVLQDDSKGPPSEIQFGAQKATVVIRGEPALRVRNPDAPTRLGFMGLDYFDFDPGWVIDAAFEAYDPPRVLEVSTVIGTVEKNANPGRIAFERNGTRYSLEAIREEGSDELFFIVADQTNAKDTYGAGRFLYAPLPVAGRVTVDFNRLFNPPCAFTSFSTCPLPPEGNRLRLRLEVGEKRYAGHTD